MQHERGESDDDDTPIIRMWPRGRPHLRTLRSLKPSKSAELHLACTTEIAGYICPQLLGDWLFKLGNTLRRARKENGNGFAALYLRAVRLVELIVQSYAFSLLTMNTLSVIRFYLLGLVEWMKSGLEGRPLTID